MCIKKCTRNAIWLLGDPSLATNPRKAKMFSFDFNNTKTKKYALGVPSERICQCTHKKALKAVSTTCELKKVWSCNPKEKGSVTGPPWKCTVRKTAGCSKACETTAEMITGTKGSANAVKALKHALYVAGAGPARKIYRLKWQQLSKMGWAKLGQMFPKYRSK